MTNLQLKVGETYQNETNSATRYRITRRWGPELFEGTIIRNDGKDGEQRYMFNSYGVAIGYPDNSGTGPFFKIREIPKKKSYEALLIFSDDSRSEWEKISIDSPWTEDTMYLVRETGKHETTRLMKHGEFLVLLDDIL